MIDKTKDKILLTNRIEGTSITEWVKRIKGSYNDILRENKGIELLDITISLKAFITIINAIGELDDKIKLIKNKL
jgi:hypothetical protein